MAAVTEAMDVLVADDGAERREERLQADLRAALAPRSVAVIGASDQPAKPGGRPISFLRRYGFEGAIYPVNPTRHEVQGLRSYASLADIPEAVDLAVVAVPGASAPRAVSECAAAAVRVAVVLSSGFGESDPDGGKAAERAMVEEARAASMRIIGPNTQGLANFANGAVVNISSMFLQQPAKDGPVAIVSQSGAMASVCYGHLRRAGIGVRHAHATGNEADVDTLELAAAICDDPDIRILLLYLESIGSADRLSALARKARARDLPVLMLKAARTEAGQNAARSHTGSLANADAAVEAMLRREGIRRAETIGELVSSVPLYLQSWRQRSGRRLAIISNSGATCVMAADAAARRSMPLARLGEASVARAAQLLPSYATPTNPLDLTSTLMTNGRLLTELLPAITADEGVDAVILGMTVAGEGYDLDGFARDAAQAVAASGKPFAVVASQPDVAEPFAERDLPIFSEEAVAVAALDELAAHRRLADRAMESRLAPAARRPAAKSWITLDEADSLAALRSGAVSVVPFRLCRTEEQAVESAAALGGAVVVKGCAAEFAHKTEHGLVRLGLGDADAVRHAFRDVMARLAEAGASNPAVIVAAMARARREMLVGVQIDPVFGPMLMVGDGGTAVEALRDTALLPVPVTAAEIREALEGLRVWPLLRGHRGERPADIGAFCELAAIVARMASEGRIGESDLNPVMVGAEDDGCLVVDALVSVPATPPDEERLR